MHSLWQRNPLLKTLPSYLVALAVCLQPMAIHGSKACLCGDSQMAMPSVDARPPGTILVDDHPQDSPSQRVANSGTCCGSSSVDLAISSCCSNESANDVDSSACCCGSSKSVSGDRVVGDQARRSPITTEDVDDSQCESPSSSCGCGDCQCSLQEPRQGSERPSTPADRTHERTLTTVLESSQAIDATRDIERTALNLPVSRVAFSGSALELCAQLSRFRC